MRLNVRRGVTAGIGAVAIGVLTVACAGRLPVGPTASPPVTIAGVSIRLPGVPFPFSAPGSTPAGQQATTQTQAGLQGATHSGEGCPIALPQ